MLARTLLLTCLCALVVGCGAEEIDLDPGVADAGSLEDGGQLTVPADGGDVPDECALTCAGQCIDPVRDPGNCGGCGQACGEGEACISSACQPDPEYALWPLPPDFPTDYTATADTVLDEVTGLMWQRQSSEPFGLDAPLSEKARLCAQLRLGGHSDWRLPTRIELVSILAMRGGLQAFNGDFFAGSTTYDYVSSSLDSDLDGDYWTVSFSHGDAELGSGNLVRCVRTHRRPTANGVRFTAADGIVTDSHTGLVWEQEGTLVLRTYDSAQEYCDGLDVGGHSAGWRIPTRKELESLVDTRRQTPVIDDSVFEVSTSIIYGVGSPYFTSSPSSASGNWEIDFNYGFSRADSYRAYVRCVR